VVPIILGLNEERHRLASTDLPDAEGAHRQIAWYVNFEPKERFMMIQTAEVLPSLDVPTREACIRGSSSGSRRKPRRG
jgi:hypothetical protein